VLRTATRAAQALSAPEVHIDTLRRGLMRGFCNGVSCSPPPGRDAARSQGCAVCVGATHPGGSPLDAAKRHFVARRGQPGAAALSCAAFPSALE